MENIELRELVGGAWKIEAKDAIRAYLIKALEGVENLIILS